MKKVSILVLLLPMLSARAQEVPAEKVQPIVEEGKRLYRSEMASWHGTDLFLENYTNTDNIGGYFSYTDKDVSTCIIYSKGEDPKVIGTLSFDSSYSRKTAKISLVERDFSAFEKQLFQIRAAADAEIISDTMFKSYNNTRLNLIPLINGGSRRVYVLTGPARHGVVILGNDYLLEFDSNNRVSSKKQLHANILPIYFDNEKDVENKVQGTMHTHLPGTGDFITATDICTLMLYARFTTWKTHNVVSEKYLNIWQCETNNLVVIPLGNNGDD